MRATSNCTSERMQQRGWLNEKQRGWLNEKLRARLKWGAGGTVPIKPRGMLERTYQRILGMIAYHEVVRKRGASYARKYRPEQHRAHLWRQCRNRFTDLGGWPVR